MPTTGANPKSGQNPDGFYQLLGSDKVAVASIVVRDSNNAFVSNPFHSGDKVKITQAPGATPSDSRPGPGVIVSQLKLKGDGILRVTDTSGNVTEVTCRVAPGKSDDGQDHGNNQGDGKDGKTDKPGDGQGDGNNQGDAKDNNGKSDDGKGKSKN